MAKLNEVSEPLGYSPAIRELRAFISAVTELYGPDEARIAAEDWIRAFESTSDAFSFKPSEWRKVTIVAASELATRVLESGCRSERLNLVKGRTRSAGWQKM